MDDKRCNLYDGMQDGFYTNRHEIVYKNERYTFTVSDFYLKGLEKLAFEMPETSFQKLLCTFNFKHSFLDEHIFYNSSEGLGVYYLIKDKIIIIVSLGEFQPARYMLFYEGVWDLPSVTHSK